MGTVTSIRAQRQKALLTRLRQEASELVGQVPQQEIWLFGSHARGDWDARSDVDLLAVAADQQQAERLADAVRDRGLADDVIALSQQAWQQRQRGGDPLWRGICRDAVRLAGGSDR
jgi:hypothetical protein